MWRGPKRPSEGGDHRNRQVIDGWFAKGYDLAADILPTLAERTKRMRTDPIRTWDYFTPAIAKRHALRMAQTAKAKGAGEAGIVPPLTEYEIMVRTAD